MVATNLVNRRYIAMSSAYHKHHFNRSKHGTYGTKSNPVVHTLPLPTLTWVVNLDLPEDCCSPNYKPNFR